MPVWRANFCLAEVTPIALFQENENPNLLAITLWLLIKCACIYYHRVIPAGFWKRDIVIIYQKAIPQWLKYNILSEKQLRIKVILQLNIPFEIYFPVFENSLLLIKRPFCLSGWGERVVWLIILTLIGILFNIILQYKLLIKYY